MQNYKHVDLQIMILYPKSKLVHEHNEAIFNAFPGYLVKIYSSRTMGSRDFTWSLQDYTVRDYFVPEMTYNPFSTGISPHCLNLEKRVFLIAIRNVFHLTLMNSRMLVVIADMTGVVQVAVAHSNRNETNPF